MAITVTRPGPAAKSAAPECPGGQGTSDRGCSSRTPSSPPPSSCSSSSWRRRSATPGAQPAQDRSQRAGPGQGRPQRGLRRPRQLHRRRSPTPSSGAASCGCWSTAPSSSRLMLGLALLFALLLDPPAHPGRAASPGSRSSCRTRCRASSPRCCGASCTCRPSARSTTSSPAGPARSRPARRRTLYFASVQHRGLGRHRLQHDRHLHLAAGRSRASCTRRPARRLLRAADRAADQDPDGRARRSC